MNYIYGAFSDIGISRPNNEDRFFAGKCSTDIPIFIGIVCDGIGGLKNGEVASESITESVKEWTLNLNRNNTFEQVTMAFLEHIYAVNEKICRQSKVNSIETGSTMSAVIVSENNFMAANVGDSRVYHVMKNIEQVTEDDVLPSDKTKRGALRQCIGFNEKFFINTYYGRIDKKESLLVCSDGFYKQMDHKRIAKKSGERDNITAYIIKNI